MKRFLKISLNLFLSVLSIALLINAFTAQAVPENTIAVDPTNMDYQVSLMNIGTGNWLLPFIFVLAIFGIGFVVYVKRQKNL